jgi:hypothetical protein
MMGTPRRKVQKIDFISVSFLQEYTDVSEKHTVPNLRSARYLFLVGCFDSTPNMEEVCSSQMSLGFYRTIRRHMLEYCTFCTQ